MAHLQDLNCQSLYRKVSNSSDKATLNFFILKEESRCCFIHCCPSLFFRNSIFHPKWYWFDHLVHILVFLSVYLVPCRIKLLNLLPCNRSFVFYLLPFSEYHPAQIELLFNLLIFLSFWIILNSYISHSRLCWWHSLINCTCSHKLKPLFFLSEESNSSYVWDYILDHLGAQTF